MTGKRKRATPHQAKNMRSDRDSTITASPSQANDRRTRPLYFFRASEPKTGFLSNWYASEPFTDVRVMPTASPVPQAGAQAAAATPEVKIYKTSEHYMMHRKALLFGDTAAAAEILDVEHPRQAQSLGRLVGGFDQDVWARERMRIVRDAIYWKFTSPLSSTLISRDNHGGEQGERGEEEREWRLADSSRAQTVRAQSFRAALLATGDRLLVEASPFDRTWGIGFSAKVADEKREMWGLNLLGRCLMDVRERFRKEDHGIVRDRGGEEDTNDRQENSTS